VDYSIVEKPAFDIVGKSRRFSEASGEVTTAIPKFWDEFLHDENSVLMNLTQNAPDLVTRSMSLGVSMCEAGMEEFNYAIGAETLARTAPLDFEVIRIPSAAWAIFESVGPMPGAIQDVTKRIFAEWFPSTGYEHPKYELEVYLPGDTSGNDYHCQVWIHINRKK
jgi:AraC family transcriptional regulator